MEIPKSDASRMNDEEKIKMYEAVFCELFDIVAPQAMPWTGTQPQKAEYTAKVITNLLRARLRLLNHVASEKRDMFAAAALTGMLSCSETNCGYNETAEYAFEYADRMMDKRNGV